MAAYQGYNAAEEVFLLHIWARRGTHGQKLRAILAMSHEEHSMLCDVACRTNERVVLETTDHRIVRDHVGQDQLSATRPTMHRSHVYRTPPVVRVIDISPIAVQVRLWICLRRTAHVPLTPDPCRVLPKSSLPQQPSSSRGGRQTLSARGRRRANGVAARASQPGPPRSTETIKMVSTIARSISVVSPSRICPLGSHGALQLLPRR